MKKIIKTLVFTLAAMFLCSGVFYTNSIDTQAASKTTTKVSTKKSTKVVKLKKSVKAKTTKKVKTKKSTKNYKEDNYKVTKVTTVKTTTVTKYASKKKTIKTTVKTTVKTTKTANTNDALNAASGELQADDAEDEGDISINDMSGIVSPMVIKAFKELDYKIVLNSNAKYAGLFDARNQQVTLRSANKGYLLHELGHFVSFVAGLKDSTPEFVNIYKKEAKNYTGSNKAYVTKNNNEYFAESVRDYYTSPSTLKNSRPLTYKYVKECISLITNERIDYVNSVYYGK